MLLRIRHRNDSHLIKDLNEQSSFEDLRQQVSAILHAEPNLIRIKSGFPPKEIITEASKTSLLDYGITNGESLLVELVGTNESIGEGRTERIPRDGVERISDELRLVRREMADDNSCLFNSIAYVLENKDTSKAQQLRIKVARAIEANADVYNEALLGQPTVKYVQWISQSNSWGGAIELSVFAQLYKVEIVAVDIQTCRFDRFGEDAHYANRVLVLYNGIHYDALAQISSKSKSQNDDRTIFPTNDDTVLVQAVAIAERAHKEHKYTDLANFTLRCSVCKKGLVGQSGAQEHASSTGHLSFQEYS